MSEEAAPKPSPETGLQWRFQALRSEYAIATDGLMMLYRNLGKFEESEDVRKAEGERIRAENVRVAEIAGEAMAIFTEPMPDRPFIEPRKVRALPGVESTPRLVSPGGLPKENLPRYFGHPASYFNTVDYFYLPSMAYLNHFSLPENQTAPPIDQRDQEIYDFATSALESRHENSKAWYPWVLATKIVGLDVVADNMRVGAQAMIHYVPFDRPSEPSRFLTKEELFEHRDDVINELVKSSGQPHRDGDQAKRLWKTLSAFRWDADHRVGLYHATLSELLELYSELNYVQEGSYPTNYRAEYELFAMHNAIARVVMGGRNEQYYHDAPISGHDNDMYFDEVDAMFLAAIHILGEDSPGLRKVRDAYAIPGLHREAAEPVRYCLYGDGSNFDHHNIDRQGLLVSMAMQYFRMDDRLRETWRPMLLDLFRLVQGHMPYSIGTHNLFVHGTANDGVERKFDDRFVDHLESPEELRTNVEAFGAFIAEPRTLTISGHGDNYITGFGANLVTQVFRKETYAYKTPTGEDASYDNHFIDIFPKGESLAEPDLHLKLRAEDRLPAEAAALVREVASDPESGNLDRLGVLKKIAERLTGRPIEDLDVVQTILALGQLKKLGEEAPTADRSTAEALIFEAQSGSRSFFELDATTQLLTILRAANRLPKVLLVEHLLQSLSSAVPISLLRFALRMEQTIRDDRPWEQGEDLFVFPVFTGRDRIAEAREKHGPSSPKFRREVIDTFTGFLGLMQTHHEYEGSVTDFLTMLELLDRTGRPMSQCTELAYVAAEMQNWMMGEEKPTSRVAYRERFHKEPLGMWLERLRRERVRTFDHVKIWTELPAGEKQERRLVIDETTGHAWLTRATVVDERRTSAMRRGEYRSIDTTVGDLDYAGHEVKRTHESEGAIVYDARSSLSGTQSMLLADIAAQFPQLRSYAEALAPDQSRRLLHIAGTAESDHGWALVDRVLQFSPRALGDNLFGMETLHQKQLVLFATYAVEHKGFCQSLFLLHVLDARYPTSSLREGNRQLQNRIMDALAVLEEKDLLEKLSEGKSKEWILPEDEVEILARHRQFLERAKRRGENTTDTMGNIRRQTEKAITAGTSQLLASGLELPEDEEQNGLGDRVSKEIKEEAAREGQEFRAEHQIEQTDNAPRFLKEQFVDLHSEGAGFAIAELVRGLSDEDREKALTAAEIVLLGAESAFGYRSIPLGVEDMWAAFQESVESQGLSLPYTRDELLKHLPEILEKLLLEGGHITGLLTSSAVQ